MMSVFRLLIFGDADLALALVRGQRLGSKFTEDVGRGGTDPAVRILEKNFDCRNEVGNLVSASPDTEKDLISTRELGIAGYFDEGGDCVCADGNQGRDRVPRCERTGGLTCEASQFRNG